jgi:hypothetical protein
MPEFGTTTAQWCLASVQVLGLLSGWLARIGEGSHHQGKYQAAFFLCLGLVGLTTVSGMLMGPCCSLSSGATLSVMILTATWDFKAGQSVMG